MPHVGGIVGGSVGSFTIGILLGILGGAGGFQLSINCKKRCEIVQSHILPPS